MSDLGKIFPILAFAATPILFCIVWSFCGGSVDFMDVAEGIASDALTDEQRAEARRALESNLITTQFIKPASDVSPSDMELGNQDETEDSGLSSSSSTPTCSICLAEYKHDEFVSRSINPYCEHLFHKDCILEWLVARVGQTFECPICRREFHALATTSDDRININESANEKSDHNNNTEGLCAAPAIRRTSASRRSFASVGSVGGRSDSSPV